MEAKNKLAAKANNTHYFKISNDDLRKGGIYHNLDYGEFRLLMILQAYANKYGYVNKENGKPYSDRELVDMISLNSRTLKKSVLGLQTKKIIQVDDGGIFLYRFTYEQNYTGNDTRRYYDTVKGALQRIEKKQERVICDSVTGEIISRGEEDVK